MAVFFLDSSAIVRFLRFHHPLPVLELVENFVDPESEAKLTTQSRFLWETPYFIRNIDISEAGGPFIVRLFENPAKMIDAIGRAGNNR